MTVDPNWFYSSLAQSAASIVGIIGAILATRLGSQIERAAKQQMTTTNALHDLEKSIRPMEQHFTEYAEQSPSQLHRLREAIDSGRTLEHCRWYSIEGVSNDVNVEPSDRIFESETARTKVTNAAIPLLRNVLSATDAQPLKHLGDDLQGILDEKSKDMTGPFQHLGKLAQLAASELELLSLQTRSKLYFALLYTLILLSLFGVVVPLLFLSAQSDIHKILLTGIFATALCILYVYIQYEISCLCRIGRYRSLLPPVPVLDGRTLR